MQSLQSTIPRKRDVSIKMKFYIFVFINGVSCVAMFKRVNIDDRMRKIDVESLVGCNHLPPRYGGCS